MKLLYIMTNESPYNIANCVDNFILTNDKKEIVYVATTVMHHDRDNTDDESLYGLYVIGKDTEGVIEISSSIFMDLEQNSRSYY